MLPPEWDTVLISWGFLGARQPLSPVPHSCGSWAPANPCNSHSLEQDPSPECPRDTTQHRTLAHPQGQQWSSQNSIIPAQKVLTEDPVTVYNHCHLSGQLSHCYNKIHRSKALSAQPFLIPETMPIFFHHIRSCVVGEGQECEERGKCNLRSGKCVKI